MGYYDGADVPVYDHLAEEFAVCDRWFASVAGATLPNRLYGLCGVAAGSRDDRPAHIPPLYHQPWFVRHLDAHHVPRARRLRRAGGQPAVGDVSAVAGGLLLTDGSQDHGQPLPLCA